jgi:hypothetical protein
LKQFEKYSSCFSLLFWEKNIFLYFFGRKTFFFTFLGEKRFSLLFWEKNRPLFNPGVVVSTLQGGSLLKLTVTT